MQHPLYKKSYNRSTSVFVLMLLILTTLAGCSEAPKTPTASKSPAAPALPVQKQPIISVPSGTVAVQTEAKPTATFTYNPAGRRDPFAPIIVRETKKAKTGDRPPLERYSISEFKLTGIVWGGFGYNAVLEGPDRKGYFVRVGTIIGQNRGVIKKITQNTMVIEEKFKNYSGETERREIVVELRKKQEEAP